MRIVILLIFSCLPFFSFTQTPDFSRMPPWLPDWLWKDQVRSAFIDGKTKDLLIKKAQNFDSALKINDTVTYTQLYKEINTTLSSKFSLMDIEIGASVVHASSYDIAVQLDPLFDNNGKKILLEAVKLFLQVALNNDVLNKAFGNSVNVPIPFPLMFDSSNMNNQIKKYTDEYAFILSCRTKPSSIAQFKKQFSAVLNTLTGDPPLLVIASYRGDDWWAASGYHHYYLPLEQLAKFSPSVGYLYMALNADSLKSHPSPSFWASKIAHETLHNLGYWHPYYETIEERDKNNLGSKQAFVIAYERAVFNKSQAAFSSNK